MTQVDPRAAAATLTQALGRRRLLQAAAGLTAAAAVSQVPGAAAASAGRGAGAAGGRPPGVGPALPGILQPHTGRTRGLYLPSRPDQVLWGSLPDRDSEAVARVASGAVVTVDTVSHEGVLPDQGQDPVQFFGDQGVPRERVLDDAVAIAATTPRTGPGPHVVTGPLAVEGAEPGGTLKVEVLDLQLRVPYGVISNRHQRGALPDLYPAAWQDDPALQRYLAPGPVPVPGQPAVPRTVSVFTPVERERGRLVGALPGPVPATFALDPFLGLMGVARDSSGVVVDSVPPTDAGGNLDVRDLGIGSTLYLPVAVPGALFFVGDPHMAQGDGEVALTAMEGSLRATLRLTAIPAGGSAPSVAFRRPFGETEEFWLPIGLSDPDGPVGGQQTSLDLAMRDAVLAAMEFLTDDLGMPGPVAYAYLSAATDFAVSQVVDRTTGIHARIRKADFGR